MFGEFEKLKFFSFAGLADILDFWSILVNFTNRYKTANNGRILDFKVSIEAYGYNASIYRFRIFKFGLVWWPSWIFGQFWSILQTCIKRLIMDGFWILRCL